MSNSKFKRNFKRSSSIIKTFYFHIMLQVLLFKVSINYWNSNWNFIVFGGSIVFWYMLYISVYLSNDMNLIIHFFSILFGTLTLSVCVLSNWEKQTENSRQQRSWQCDQVTDFQDSPPGLLCLACMNPSEMSFACLLLYYFHILLFLCHRELHLLAARALWLPAAFIQ